MSDSFSSKSTLSVSGNRVRDLPARRAAGEVRRRAAAVLDEGPAREHAAAGGRRVGRRGQGRRDDRLVGRGRRAERGDPVPARPGADAGLHRRAGDRRPRRDARRDGRARLRPLEDQPAGPGRPRDRPLGSGRCLRQRARLRHQRRPRLRAQPRALRLPALGPAGVRQLPRRPAGDRDLPPGQPRVPEPGRLQPRGRRRHPGLSRHARRHRLAHDDGQRARRSRLGRRRDRGRGGDARPADLDAAAAGGRIPASTASCPRARRPPTSCSPSPRCCASAASSRSSSSSTGPGCTRSGLADRATIGNMSPEFGSTCAIFPVDRETLRYLEFTGRPTETIELVDAYAREQGMFHDEDSEDPTFSDTLDLDLSSVAALDRRPEAPAGPDRARQRQAGVHRVAGGVRRGRRDSARQRRSTRHRAESFPASDPPGRGSRRRGGQASRVRADRRAARASRRSPSTRPRR